MKVAVCFSGLIRGCPERNISILKNIFSDFDFFFSTWEERCDNKEEILNKFPNIHFINEPKMHYHPILDSELKEKKYLERIEVGKDKIIRDPWFNEINLHRTKQVLAHNELLYKIPQNYDMIIRARYDVLTSVKVDFHSFLKESYEKKIAIGFGTFKGDFRIDRAENVKDAPKIYMKPYHEIFLFDQMIFHRRDIFDQNLVNHLHKHKKLFVSEHGWYQILSEPFGDNHENYFGGVVLDRYVPEPQ